ncbi:MAG: DegT/DnrJ/EryC1/StrS family aminotransferase [Acidobacteriota bacterium]
MSDESKVENKAAAELESIPSFDPTPEVEALWPELQAAAEGVLRSGRYILGPEVKAFEEECADLLGCRYALGVANGTDALILALEALGIGPGDEVITTAFTFFATAEAIMRLGAHPVFVDIDEATFNLDPAGLAAALTPRTRAVLPVHLFGLAADLEGIQTFTSEHGLHVVEDVAQAFGGRWNGRRLGTLGSVGTFSFFPTKNLGGFGDGGLVVTDDEEVAGKVARLRAHGARRKYANEELGWNSRLDALQAALLRVKLRHLDSANEGRRRAAQRYDELLADVPQVQTPCAESVGERGRGNHVYHQYTLRLPVAHRDSVRAALAERGVNTMVYYPVPIHRLPVWDSADEEPEGVSFPALPRTEAAAASVLSLPLWPTISTAVQERVVETLVEVLAQLPEESSAPLEDLASVPARG